MTDGNRRRRRGRTSEFRDRRILPKYKDKQNCAQVELPLNKLLAHVQGSLYADTSAVLLMMVDSGARDNERSSVCTLCNPALLSALDDAGACFSWPLEKIIEINMSRIPSWSSSDADFNARKSSSWRFASSSLSAMVR
jgi:hypothetical protein